VGVWVKRVSKRARLASWVVQDCWASGPAGRQLLMVSQSKGILDEWKCEHVRVPRIS